MKWAVRTRYLVEETVVMKKSGALKRFEKWHQHTTHWYDDSEDAWNEKEAWEINMNKKHEILESSSSLIHKGV